MANIDIGAPAIEERSSSLSGGYTVIEASNPANLSGIITLVKIFAESAMIGVKVGIFYKTNGNTFSTRSSVTLGNVADRDTEHIVNLAVEAGDYIGIYFTGGSIVRDTTGFVGAWLHLDDDIPCTNVDFTFYDGDQYSLEGEGAEPGWTGKISGVTNPAKVMGVAVANIAKVKGIA